MSWLEKLLPPKIQPTDPAERRSVPEGLWVKCPSCETVLYKTDLEQNQSVCPKCAHHHRIGARERLDTFLDPEGRYEIGEEVLPVDPLGRVEDADMALGKRRLGRVGLDNDGHHTTLNENECSFSCLISTMRSNVAPPRP